MSTSRVFTVGQVLTAAQMNDLPQGVLGKTTVTADQAGIGATETDIITAPAVTVAGTTRRLRIGFTCRGFAMGVVGDVFTVRIKEGATTLAELNVFGSSTLAAPGADFFAIVDSPTAASHTYKATFQRASGTGTATVAASATGPLTLTVEDVGQV